MEDDYTEPAPQAEPGWLQINETRLKYDAQRMFDSIAQHAASNIVENIARDLKAEVTRSVKQQIDAQVGAIVSAALDTNIQPTNEWGEPKGKPLSLREMVGNSARNYLGVKVNKDGAESTYNADTTRLEFIVKKVVASEFDYRMQTEVKKAVEMARNEAVAKVSTVVGDLIVKLGK